jgi:hypothetical protein
VGCVVGLSIALVVLVGGAVLADGVTRSIAEDVAADAVRTQIDTTGDLTVSVEGTPFLTQLASGTLDRIRLHADGATVSGIAITDLDILATDVTVRGDRSAAEVVATGTVPIAQIEQTMRERTGWDLTAAVEGDTLVATGAVLGVPVSASFTVAVAEDGTVVPTLQQVTLAGLAVDASALPDGLGARLGGVGSLTDQLPAGATLTDAQVQADGLRITAQMHDVTADSL